MTLPWLKKPEPLIFVGNPAPLTDADIAEASELLGVTPAHVRAVLAVESKGRGFHPYDHRPTILFEPHVFHRLTKGKFSKKHGGVSYPDWGQKPYPRLQSERYAQLEYAMNLNRSAALQSASWGLGQIMGFNYEACGFLDVEAFVRAMVKSEREQLLAFCRLLKTWGLAEKLKRGDWAGFARVYNGPGHAKHDYAGKLAAAHARFA